MGRFHFVALFRGAAIILSVLSGIMIIGSSFYPVFAENPGKPSVQLLPSRGLAVLRDEFVNEPGQPNVPDGKAQLKIVNHTPQTLTVELNGDNGKFRFELSPATDNTWSVNAGTYHSEVSISGFPPMSGAAITLSGRNAYKWEIWRSQL